MEKIKLFFKKKWIVIMLLIIIVFLVVDGENISQYIDDYIYRINNEDYEMIVYVYDVITHEHQQNFKITKTNTANKLLEYISDLVKGNLKTETTNSNTKNTYSISLTFKDTMIEIFIPQNGSILINHFQNPGTKQKLITLKHKVKGFSEMDLLSIIN